MPVKKTHYFRTLPWGLAQLAPELCVYRPDARQTIPTNKPVLHCTTPPFTLNRSAAGHLDFNPGQLKGDSTSELILCLSKNRAPHLTKLMWYTYMKDISNQQHTFNNVEIRIKVHYTYKSSLFFLSYPSARAHFFSILPKTKLWGGGRLGILRKLSGVAYCQEEPWLTPSPHAWLEF